jgi:hypothetical protein
VCGERGRECLCSYGKRSGTRGGIDLCATLGCDYKPGGRGKGDGQGDALWREETTAVGDKEK